MIVSRLAPAVLGVVLLVGCGWKRDLAAGQDAATRGDWLAAVEHYEAAASAKPDDAALKARLVEARELAVDQLVEQAQAAISGGAPYDAVELLDQAEAVLPRQLPVGLAREEAVSAIAAQVRASLAGGEDPVAQAYEAWAVFAEHFPVHPEPARLQDEIEAALGAEAQALVDAGDFAAARGRLSGFAGRLPLEEQLAAVDHAWAAALATQAQAAARRRQRASAWVAMALAAKLGGDAEHLRLRDQYRDSFLKTHGPVVGPQLVAADRAGLDRLDAKLQAAFSRAGLRWAPGAPKATLGGRITMAEPRFEQSAKATVAVYEVPGPEREHENPAWLRAQAELEGAQASLEGAAADEQRVLASRAAQQRSLDGMTEGLAAVEASLEGLRAAVAQAETAANSAQAALDESVGASESVSQLQEQRAGLEQRVAGAQAALDGALAALEADGQGGDTAGANQAVGQARRALEDARAALEAAPRPTNLSRELARHVGTRAGQLAEAERALEAARATLADAEAPVRDQLEAVASIEARLVELGAELEAAREAQAQAQQALEQAQASLEGIPPTIFGPTIERLEIPVQAHMRSCVGEISVELRAGASRGVTVTRSLKARAETRDEQRPAVPEQDLEEDPLDFPEGDLELQARVEAVLFRQLGELLQEQVAQLARASSAQVAELDDPEARLRVLLEAWLLDPGQDQAGIEIDGQRIPARELERELEERWGLGDLSCLDG
jgi:hypothetical protein